jgi:DNA (cytosine-5)-methyltransferase 1
VGEAVKPRVIMLENVEEFEEWGPLLDNNMPDPLRAGLTFRIWKGKLTALGYKVEHRLIVCSDYGAPTTRKRLFLIARCDGQPIVWPEKSDELALTDYRVAADLIQWERPTYSIFLTAQEGKQHNVRRPLAENTMRRVYRGFEKFVVNEPNPFLLTLNHTGGKPHAARSLEQPMRTLTASRDAHALVTPIITEHANASNPRSWRADEPLRTQCGSPKGGHFALLAPFMVPRYGEDPNPARRGGLGQAPRARSVNLPMPTIVPSQNGAQLVAAFLAKHNGGHEATGQDAAPLDRHGRRAREQGARHLLARQAEGHLPRRPAAEPPARHRSGRRAALRRDPRVSAALLRLERAPRASTTRCRP